MWEIFKFCIDDFFGCIVILELVQQFWRCSGHSGLCFVMDCFHCIPHLLSYVSNWILQCGLSLIITYLWHCTKSYLRPSRVSAVLNTAATALSFSCTEILMITELAVVFSLQLWSPVPPTEASRAKGLLTRGKGVPNDLMTKFWLLKHRITTANY